ncbi:hypothetical protein QMZ62_23585 [Serratia sp. PF2-63]|uniref:hypothetical protein n=1 Tax=unclassified Serratia (in: enterobacteria) TaxID=2647522 RepID=UPI0024B4E772|nr:MULTISPECIES: hypothetical protein [unclassified Serratia (in: enterobacteria)]MDI9265935.1 hypothetical protein [Serratia sp. PF2-63]MDI9267098.1 hypothetical protein [Serratia sp. PF-27]
MSIATPLNLPFALAPVTQNDIIRVLGEYTFIRLDNGDEAFYHHGNWITGADASCGEPSVLGLAQSMARAGCKSLRSVELPVPDDKEWSWDDVVTQLVRASFTRQVRGELTVTVTENTRHGRGVHVCSDPLLSGMDNNLWFPLNEEEDWHAGIERVLTMNGVAENVVRLEPLREGSEYTDLKVIYNRKICA